METAKEWGSNATQNAESFDVEEVEGNDKAVDLVINGFYHCILSLDDFKFTGGEGCEDSKAMKKLLAFSNEGRKETEGGAAAIKEACNSLTKAYQKYSDALDAEAAADGEVEEAPEEEPIVIQTKDPYAGMSPEQKEKAIATQKYIDELKQNSESGDLTPGAVLRILSDFKYVKESESTTRGWYALPHKNSVQTWEVHITDCDKGSKLDKDMDKWSQARKIEKSIVLQLTFHKSYPQKPPFVRVIRPIFVQYTAHVTLGGGVCMQPLTDSGWNAQNDITSIIEMLRTNIVDSNAAVDHNQTNSDYDINGAKDGFLRVLDTHKKDGWHHSLDGYKFS